MSSSAVFKDVCLDLVKTYFKSDVFHYASPLCLCRVLNCLFTVRSMNTHYYGVTKILLLDRNRSGRLYTDFLKFQVSSIQFYLVPSHNSSCLKCVILKSTLGTVPERESSNHETISCQQAPGDRGGAPAEPGRGQLSAGWGLRGKEMRKETIGRQDKT